MTQAIRRFAPHGIDAETLVEEFGSPLYVYDESVLRDRARRLASFCRLSNATSWYACKANSNPTLLGIVREEGLRLDAVSPGEVLAGLRTGWEPREISFNGNSVSRAEFAWVSDQGVHVTVDSRSQLESYASIADPQRPIGLRIDPGRGAGHHPHVVTGGAASKFGIPADELDDAIAFAESSGLTIDGVHQHIGSGILEIEPLLEAARTLADLVLSRRRRLPGLRFVDFGGGFGVPYRRGEAPFDFETFAWKLTPIFEELRSGFGEDLDCRIQPGRFVMAECGVLLLRVTAIQRTRSHTFAGTDSGMNHLLRPALYSSHHEVEFASRREPLPFIERYTVVGNICETGDVLARDAPLPRLEIGDVLAIRTAGAYGFAMASNYNARPRPAEVLISPPEFSGRLIRHRESLEDVIGTSPPPPSPH